MILQISQATDPVRTPLPIHLPTLLPTSLPYFFTPKQYMAYLDHHIQSVSILCAFGAPSLSVLFCPLYDVCTYS